MARQLHGHALGYAGSHEIANRRSSQVVRNTARARSQDARSIPRMIVSTVMIRWPAFLPDGKHFLYLSVSDFVTGASAIHLGSLEGMKPIRLMD